LFLVTARGETSPLFKHCTRVLTHWFLAAAAAVRSYGYDPLGLGKDKETVEKYRANELIHARWAMLAAAGIIIPEGLQVRGGCVICSQPVVVA
jgi:hypothetical protein